MRVGFGLALVTLVASLSLAPPWQQTAGATTCAPTSPPGQGKALPVDAEASPVAEETRIHWTRADRRITYGDLATLAGQVVTARGAVPGVAVDLYVRTPGGWELARSTTADPDTGAFAFGCLEPRRSTDYRVVHEGSLTYGRSQAERRVAVSRRMPDALRRVDRSRFVLHGSVSPRYSGLVTLQRSTCAGCAWRDVARRRATDRSTWRFLVDVAGLRGEARYRAMIPADTRFARSVSARVWRFTTAR